MRFFSFNLELVCTSEFFKKLKLHEPLRRVQFRFLKNSQVQINSKLNEKNRMITYTNRCLFSLSREINNFVFSLSGFWALKRYQTSLS